MAEICFKPNPYRQYSFQACNHPAGLFCSWVESLIEIHALICLLLLGFAWTFLLWLIFWHVRWTFPYCSCISMPQSPLLVKQKTNNMILPPRTSKLEFCSQVNKLFQNCILTSGLKWFIVIMIIIFYNILKLTKDAISLQSDDASIMLNENPVLH